MVKILATFRGRMGKANNPEKVQKVIRPVNSLLIILSAVKPFVFLSYKAG